MSILLWSCLATVAFGDETAASALKQLSLQELAKIEVVTPAKKPETLFKTASAVYVLTGEDIRRSGATSIPEALRLVPGVNVARLTADQWAISIRGFNDQFSDKLLVLMDGRTLYSPVFQGVLWDVQDTLLEDVARIEVIRGPGCALWGANAVNGVINIITKSAEDTQGAFASGGGGTQERGFGEMRFGRKVGGQAFERVYAKYFDRASQDFPGDGAGSDAWRMGRGGFRFDWDASPRDALLVQGDVYKGVAGDGKLVPDQSSPTLARTVSGFDRRFGGNVQTQWKRVFSEDSDLALKVYYDRAEAEKLGVISVDTDIFDVDFQRRFRWIGRQEIVWGLGYRMNKDVTASLGSFSFSPPARTTEIGSGFVEDEIALVEDRLRLTIGAKLEHNDYTAWEVQPNVRALWTPREGHAAWAAVSRAVRTPSRVDQGLTANVPTFPPSGALLRVTGTPNYKSEELLAYELGYRVQPIDTVFLDVAAFYDIYDRLRVFLPGAPNPGPPPVVPVALVDAQSARSYGGELAGDWQALSWWRLKASYSFLEIHLEPQTQLNHEPGDSPRNQWVARSLMDLPLKLELDGALRYVDVLPSRSSPSYLAADVRVGWKPAPAWELSVAFQNLLAGPHVEFAPQSILSLPTQVAPGVYGRITWRL